MNKKFRRVQSVEVIDGENYITERGEKVLHLRRGMMFNGSKISDSGKWAVCQSCGRRHSVGLRCAHCNPMKSKPRPEHQDKRKPDNVKGS